MPWHHLAPWRSDPAEALHELQADLLRKNYDLPTELQSHLHSARESVRLTEAEGDPYGILHEYRKYLARIERIARRPLPTEPMQQVALLRQIWKTYGEGIGNVLDVTAVSNRQRAGVSCRLSQHAMRELFGTLTPSCAQAKAALNNIYDSLQRGESICFPVYRVKGRQPIGWYFIGYSID